MSSEKLALVILLLIVLAPLTILVGTAWFIYRMYKAFQQDDPSYFDVR